jgi:LPS sulfotransferase NodH
MTPPTATRPTPFVILTTQRTGSTWLVTLLDSHPRVATYGELFLDAESRRPPFGAAGLERFAYFRGASGLRARRPLRTFAYLDQLFAGTDGTAAVGFKLMYSQLRRYPEIALYLCARRVRVIHLVRTNLLDMLISRAAMNARRVAHVTRDHQGVEALQVTLNERSLYGHMRALDAQVGTFRRVLRALRIPHVEVSYEQLVAGGSSLTSVVRWLGLPDADASSLTSQIVKPNGDGSSRLVRNYDAVSKRLQRTKYASFVGR